MAEAGGVECFNSEITRELSGLSDIGNDNTEIPTFSETPRVLFADTAEQENDEFPEVESSPAGDSSPNVSSPTESTHCSSWSPILLLALITFIFSVAAGVSESVRAIFYSCFKWLRTTGFVIISFITNLLQAAQSATSCSTAQYKPYFRFFAGPYMQIGFGTALIVLIVAVLLQCGAQAASVEASGHINASNTLLTGQRISPFMSTTAAESLMQHKDGNWLFSYQQKDLEVHVATLPPADRDYSLDWCLDSGASRHFCNDSTRFVSMKKCNISISTAKKGETLQAIGIGDCKIAVQTANGDLVNLVLHDVLYVPEARRNLLSGSQLSKDRFQVVLPAHDSVFSPRIYNCRKNKISVEHSIPIVAVGSLFHIHTCADAEIKRHDRKDNLYIVWHRRLGYMPLDTIRMMIDTI